MVEEKRRRKKKKENSSLEHLLCLELDISSLEIWNLMLVSLEIDIS